MVTTLCNRFVETVKSWKTPPLPGSRIFSRVSGYPRGVITGVLNTNSQLFEVITMKCNVLVDWLTFTVRDCSQPETVINWYLGLDAPLFERLPYGMNGYTSVRAWNDIYVMSDPAEGTNARSMGVCVSMSGSGCRFFENHSCLAVDFDIDNKGTASLAFPALFHLLMVNDCNVSRIDIACDDHDGLLDLDLLTDCFMDNNINSRMQHRQIVRSFDGSNISGTTLYLGAPSSDFRVRIYDKAKEQGDFSSHWVRVELVLRGKNALAFVANFCNCDLLGVLVSGIINNKFSFIDRDDCNISRCSVCGWWLEFVGNLSEIELFSREVVQHSIDEVADWAIHQLAPSLGMLFVAKGKDWIRDFLLNGIQRMGIKREILVYDYLSSSN